MTSLKNKKILITEDETALRDALKDKLTREGFLVLEAKNGEEGLEIALNKHPDLILLDIIMPKMDGITMLKKLRETPWGKKARVILLTNINDTDRISQAMKLGSYEYLVKTDWKIEDVVDRINERLAK